MNYYLLEHPKPLAAQPGEVRGFLVRAPLPKVARQLAAEQHGTELATLWLEVAELTRLATHVDGEPGVVLRDRV